MQGAVEREHDEAARRPRARLLGELRLERVVDDRRQRAVVVEEEAERLVAHQLLDLARRRAAEGGRQGGGFDGSLTIVQAL